MQTKMAVVSSDTGPRLEDRNSSIVSFARGWERLVVSENYRKSLALGFHCLQEFCDLTSSC